MQATLIFELAKFNLGRVRGLGGLRGLGDKWDGWDKGENYSVIVRSLFALLVLFSSIFNFYIF